MLWDPKKHSTAQTRRREECQPNLEKTSQEIKPKFNQTFADYPEDYPEDCPEDSSDIGRFGGGDIKENDIEEGDFEENTFSGR